MRPSVFSPFYDYQEGQINSRVWALRKSMKGFQEGKINPQEMMDWAQRQAKGLRTRLQDGENEFSASSMEKLIAEYDKLSKSMEKAVEAKTKLDEAEQGAGALQDNVDRIEMELEKAKKKFPEIYKDIANEVAKPLDTAAEKLKKHWEEFALKAKVLTDPNFAAGPAPKQFNQGGLIGGTQGFDNQLIRAHSGEHITNSQMTARYYPVLRAINEGSYPTGGGNTYAMTFNVSGGQTTGQTVRNIGKELRRAIDRRQIPGLS